MADDVCDEKLIEYQYLARTDLPGPQILNAQIEDARQSIKELMLSRKKNELSAPFARRPSRPIKILRLL